MQNILPKQAPHLRISHQSEVLILRQTLATLQAEMKEMRKHINQIDVSPRLRKITLSSNGQHNFIALDDIVYCEADGSYTKVFIRQKNEKRQNTLAEHFDRLSGVRSRSQPSILISKSLKSVVDLISSDNFIRCHQSYLINKKHVLGFQTNNGLQLTLSNERLIPVSRRNKKLVLKMFSTL